MRQIVYLILLLCGACQSQSSDDQQASSGTPKSSPIRLAAAHWVAPQTLLIDKQYSQQPVRLINSLDSLTATKEFTLTPVTMPAAIANKYPHLSAFNSYRLELENTQIKQLLKQPLVIISGEKNSSNEKGTRVQTALLLDALYAAGSNDANEITDFGAQLDGEQTQFKLWAPTARSVKVLLFEQDKQPLTPASIVMEEDEATGVWSATSSNDLTGMYYQYEVEIYHSSSEQVETIITTDPYSLSLSTNSKYSQIVNLNHSDTMPKGWLDQQDNSVNHPEDNIFYETHIRDFSAFEHALSNEKHRGKYLAFTEQNSQGIKHLNALRDAGINSIHLLPTFDIGTINEDESQVVNINHTLETACQRSQLAAVCDLATDKSQTIASYLAALPTDSEQQQALVSALRSIDSYNWGYDPFHYTVPEGSYAVNPEGMNRIVEFRAMVQALHNLGFRVIMDVVYNHTHQAALEPTAVLDKIVPNYYQRLDTITGEIAQSTCCDNTATEHAMMEKLMIDSLVVWARDYKIDGFRFDLMAHQPKAAMLLARQAVQAVDPDTYFYGEGWNFGEVANNQRFVQASQLELSGTEIGTFTDRLRDAVRGGAFNAQGSDIRKSQGIGNGLATIPNELQTSDAQHKYYQLADQLRIGLTGNLANYPLVTASDDTSLGKEISYGGQPTGYALDPADTINYVSKHDNQTLWDNNQYRIAYHLSTAQRVRMQLQSLSYVLFAQGIPFIHMGSELLRSKGFLRDSYDYGDWFNKVDFSQQSNNYNIGLPPAEKDQQNWQMIREILSNNAGKDLVSAQDIAFSSAVFLDQIKLRMSSPLFRLTNENEILKRVKFHNTGSKQTLGLIVMSIEGDEQSPSLMVIFNSAENSQHFAFTDAKQYQLHPVLQQGADPLVKTSSATDSGFTVPGLTTAVFIKQ
ncbi:pullulanase-type alpha-1,6-glucosidase [Thalassotalea sp. G2M2-11]|uniref:pullulanase-type alpha-1,6-glucosidase n=1 Tax=Thalassotalea sp. G2M2-11 TaxID=2787627 RepID=UPI0019D26D2D|nr:pullulanase-type alpha-1,6-glucosidase [Thalassotalea sp. G2M2-11]